MNFITSYDNDPWERGAVVVGVGKTWGGEGWFIIGRMVCWSRDNNCITFGLLEISKGVDTVI